MQEQRISQAGSAYPYSSFPSQATDYRVDRDYSLALVRPAMMTTLRYFVIASFAFWPIAGCGDATQDTESSNRGLGGKTGGNAGGASGTQSTTPSSGGDEGATSGGASGAGGTRGSGGAPANGGTSGATASGGSSAHGGALAFGGASAHGGANGGGSAGGATVAGASGSSGSSAGGSPANQGGTTGAATGGSTYTAVCTSNKMSNAIAGATMRPGYACVSCHNIFLAGTVYPTAHEPDGCNGVNVSNATVKVTNADGSVTSIPINNVGNFYTDGSKLIPPIQIELVYNGATRAMQMPLSDTGDCNACHTERGDNGAPGRVMLP